MVERVTASSTYDLVDVANPSSQRTDVDRWELILYCKAGTRLEIVYGTCAPVSCGAGTYNPVDGLRFTRYGCLSSPAGAFVEESLGASRYTPCPPSLFGNVSNAASLEEGCPNASLCLPGTFGNVSGATSMDAACPDRCPAGAYGDVVGARTQEQGCHSCPGATYQTLRGQQQCTPCPPGEHTLVEGADSTGHCMLCPPGWVPDNATSICTRCGPGKFRRSDAETGLYVCAWCPPGTYNPSWAAPSVEACVPCPRGAHGTQMPATSAVSCAPCPVGTFGAVPGLPSADDCTPCPSGGMTRSNGSLSVHECNQCGAVPVCARRSRCHHLC